jgi:hypothetical protein
MPQLVVTSVSLLQVFEYSGRRTCLKEKMMRARLNQPIAVPLLVLAMALLWGGCAPQTDESNGDSAVLVESSSDPSHGGWWCVEHGIPEAECSMCSVKAAEDFKAKGDWCEEHNRAESQCFICHPELAEKFAKLYEAKFGQAPPKPEEE